MLRICVVLFPQTVENIFQVRGVQFVKAVFHLGDGQLLAAYANGRTGRAQHVNNQLCYLVNVLPVELTAQALIANSLIHFSPLLQSIHPSHARRGT